MVLPSCCQEPSYQKQLRESQDPNKAKKKIILKVSGLSKLHNVLREMHNYFHSLAKAPYMGHILLNGRLT